MPVSTTTDAAPRSYRIVSVSEAGPPRPPNRMNSSPASAGMTSDFSEIRLQRGAVTRTPESLPGPQPRPSLGQRLLRGIRNQPLLLGFPVYVAAPTVAVGAGVASLASLCSGSGLLAGAMGTAAGLLVAGHATTSWVLGCIATNPRMNRGSH